VKELNNRFQLCVGSEVWMCDYLFLGGNTFDSSWFSLVWWFLLSGRHYSFLMDQDALRQQGEVYIRKTKLTGFPKRSIHLPDRVHLSIYGLHINLAFSEIIYPFCSLLCEHQYVGSTNWTAGRTDPSPSMDKPHFKLIPNWSIMHIQVAAMELRMRKLTT